MFPGSPSLSLAYRIYRLRIPYKSHRNRFNVSVTLFSYHATTCCEVTFRVDIKDSAVVTGGVGIGVQVVSCPLKHERFGI